jgi:hypothetical protein
MVLIAGAVGGFASWVYGLILGDPVPGGGWAIPTAIFLGAFASGIGVYVLTNTDTSAVARTLFFAALCGFVWKPVCDAGKAFIQQTIQQKQDASAEDAGNTALELAESLSNTPPAQLANKLEQINDAAASALDSLPQVNNAKVRRNVETKINAALRHVSVVAPQEPQAASKVIQSVGETAARNQAAKVSGTAMMSLKTLAPKHPAFAAAHGQLTTNVTATVSGRYLLTPVIKQP